MRRGLLADENPRETLIKVEQLGSALSDDVVSPIIGRVKSPGRKIMQGALHVLQSPGFPDKPGLARWVEAPSAVHQMISDGPQAPSHCKPGMQKRIDVNLPISYIIREVKTYSSRQAARKLGIPYTTLSTYISVGKIVAPKSITTGDITVYLWTDADIEKVRQLLPKIANGRKTRYSNLRDKQQGQVEKSAARKTRRKNKP